MALATFVGEVTVGADPELRYTPSGAAVCNFRAASSSRKFNKQTQEWEDGDTSWSNFTVWNQFAENVAESVKTGDRLVVIGKIHNRPWEDKDGGKHISADVVVDSLGPSLRFATARITKASRSSEGGQQGGQWPAQQPTQDPWATGPQSSEPPF